MRRLACVCVSAAAVGSAVAAGGGESRSKHLDPVIRALEDLRRSIESEQKNAVKNYKCVKEWCDGEITTKMNQIDAAKEVVEGLRSRSSCFVVLQNQTLPAL